MILLQIPCWFVSLVILCSFPLSSDNQLASVSFYLCYGLVNRWYNKRRQSEKVWRVFSAFDQRNRQGSSQTRQYQDDQGEGDSFFYDGLIGVFPSFVFHLFIYPISNSTHPTHWEGACLLTSKVVWCLPQKNLHLLRPLVGQNLGRSRMMSLPSCLVNQLWQRLKVLTTADHIYF